jgi:hypothetical protein
MQVHPTPCPETFSLNYDNQLSEGENVPPPSAYSSFATGLSQLA